MIAISLPSLGPLLMKLSNTTFIRVARSARGLFTSSNNVVFAKQRKWKFERQPDSSGTEMMSISHSEEIAEGKGIAVSGNL